VAESFGEMLRRLRIEANLSQEALGHRARLSPETIAALETGKRRSPRLRTVAEIAEALDLDKAVRVAFTRAAKGVQIPLADAEGLGAPRYRVSPNIAPRPIPVPFTPLVGRDAEVAAIASEVGAQRLISIVGPGGVGKTRVAIQVALTTTDKFEGGTFWVELGAVEDGGSVANALRFAAGLTEQPGRSVADQLTGLLDERPVLIVFDNCEHILDAAAALVTQLLCHPAISIITTSREPLGILGEVNWPVPVLSAPDEDTNVTAEEAAEHSAVELFTDRAMRADPSFRLTDANAGLVAKICRRLDGMPLAIELMAARVRIATPSQLANELDQHLSLSSVKARGVPARQSTLWASIDWSYRLLPEDEKTIFRCIAGFSGSFTAQALVIVSIQVAHAVRSGQAEQILVRLVDKSLLSVREPEGSEPAMRYAVLETIRAYAVDRAVEAGEIEAIRDAHADYYLDWLGAHDTADPTDADVIAVGEEYLNIRAALSWSIDQRSTRAVRLVLAFGSCWHLLSRFNDAVLLGDSALAVVADMDKETWAKAVGVLALARALAGDIEFLIYALPEAEQIATATGDRRTQAWVSFVLGSIAPFDDAKLATAYETAMSVGAVTLAAIVAASVLSGGAADPAVDWKARVENCIPQVDNGSVLATCYVALIDTLSELGELEAAAELALSSNGIPQVMPSIRLLTYGRLLNIAFLRQDEDLASLAESIGDDVARRWPARGYLGLGLQNLKLALMRGERPEPPSPEDTMHRMGMTPVSLRVICRAAIDRGERLDPREVAHLRGLPPHGSLLEASISAIDGSQATIDGDDESAIAHWAVAIGAASKAGYLLLVCEAFEAFAAIAARKSNLDLARLLQAASDGLREGTAYRFRFNFEGRALDDLMDAIAAARGTYDETAPAATVANWEEAASIALEFADRFVNRN
jgi:predicted ATPase/transcriptional regulator with XRE-family HTH domain